MRRGVQIDLPRKKLPSKSPALLGLGLNEYYFLYKNVISSVIRQKGEFQNVCISGGKKCLFFGNFGLLCFLETPARFEIRTFALLPTI